MDAVSLRGHDMGKKRRLHRDLRPETTTGARLTNIPDPRSRARFQVGDRVGWDDGDMIYLGTIKSHLDGCYVRVQLDDGRICDLPTFAQNLRRVAIPVPGVESSIPEAMVSESVVTHIEATPTPVTVGVDDTLVPIGERAIESDYYETIDTVTAGDMEQTSPNRSPRWRR